MVYFFLGVSSLCLALAVKPKLIAKHAKINNKFLYGNLMIPFYTSGNLHALSLTNAIVLLFVDIGSI